MLAQALVGAEITLSGGKLIQISAARLYSD
jgi:hypothetical protein